MTPIATNFFASPPIQTALLIASLTAIVSAVIGVFTIIRGQSFAGHALADISSAGGAAAYLAGIPPLAGFLGVAILAAGALEFTSVRQAPANTSERDLVTGIILGAGLGLTALLLYLDVTTGSTTGAAITIMFGSMFAIPNTLILPTAAIAAIALLAITLIYRPLLLTALDPTLAQRRGVNPRLVSLIHLLILSLAVTLSAMTIGAILSTALLIGPAAAALKFALRPAATIALAILFALTSTWAGIILAYDSYGWTPGHTWPVSFFIVTIIFAIYLLTLVPWRWLERPGRAGG